MLSRRDFIKISAATAGGVALGGAAAAPAAAATTRLGMYYDNQVCIGCKACQMACKQWNQLPPVSTAPGGIYENPRTLSYNVWTFIQLIDYPVSSTQNYAFFKTGCRHCGHPACAAICPTSALVKQPNGLVTVDTTLCNGCGYCTQVCPFNIPQLQVYDTFSGAAKAQKCTFCQTRIPVGELPYCVQSCPVGALAWGNWDDMVARGQERVSQLKSTYPHVNLYGPGILGGLGRVYLLLAPPEQYGLPANPSFPFGLTLWKQVLHPAGQAVFGAALLGLLAAFFAARRRVHMEEVE